MSGGFDMDSYLKEKITIEFPRIEVYLIVMGLCFGFENKKLKEGRWIFQPLGKKLVDSLRVKGILPFDEDVILEWLKKGFT